MTVDGAVTLAGVLLIVGGFGAPLFSRAFCTRPVPAWSRQARDVALGLVGVRWATRQSDVPIDAWWIAAVFLSLAIAQGIVFGFNLWSALRGGERCSAA